VVPILAYQGGSLHQEAYPGVGAEFPTPSGPFCAYIYAFILGGVLYECSRATSPCILRYLRPARDPDEERRQMQETLAYGREMKQKQMKEIIAGPPRRVTATPAGRRGPKPNGRQ
jgi:hypothetical protein